MWQWYRPLQSLFIRIFREHFPKAKLNYHLFLGAFVKVISSFRSDQLSCIHPTSAGQQFHDVQPATKLWTTLCGAAAIQWGPDLRFRKGEANATKRWNMMKHMIFIDVACWDHFWCSVCETDGREISKMRLLRWCDSKDITGTWWYTQMPTPRRFHWRWVQPTICPQLPSFDCSGTTSLCDSLLWHVYMAIALVW